MSSVSAFGNGLAPKSALVFVENMWLTPDMARRIIYSFARIRARGASIRGNQGYRWKGVAADRRIGALGLGEERTSDGTGNQFYQKGREDAGYTPSAATPGFSNHGDGNSVDTDCSNLQIRDEEFAKVGLRRDIASETWHATIFRDPSVDLSGISLASNSSTPFDNTEKEEDEDMSTTEMYIRRESTGRVVLLSFGIVGTKAQPDGSPTSPPVLEVNRREFFTRAEYDDHRAMRQSYNDNLKGDEANVRRGKLYVPPASPAEVLGVTEGGWSALSSEYGV